MPRDISESFTPYMLRKYELRKLRRRTNIELNVNKNVSVGRDLTRERY